MMQLFMSIDLLIILSILDIVQSLYYKVLLCSLAEYEWVYKILEEGTS